MNCQRCGASNPPTALLCGRCGGSLLAVPASMPASVPASPPASMPAAGVSPPPQVPDIDRAPSIAIVIGALTVFVVAFEIVAEWKTSGIPRQWRRLATEFVVSASFVPMLIAGILALRRRPLATAVAIGMAVSALTYGYPRWALTLGTFAAIGLLVATVVMAGTDRGARSWFVPAPALALRRPGRVIGLVGVAAMAVVALGRVGEPSYGPHPVRGYDVIWKASPVLVVMLLVVVALGLLSRPESPGIGLAIGGSTVFALDAILPQVIGRLAGYGAPSGVQLVRLIAVPVVLAAFFEMVACAPRPAVRGVTIGGRDMPSLATSGAAWATVAPRTASVVPASLGRRFGANLIDGLFGLVPVAVMYAGLFASLSGHSDGSQQANPAALAAGLLVGLALSLLLLVINVVLWRSAQSIGKRMVGLHVVNIDSGTQTTFGQMAMRELVFRGIVIGLLSFATCGLGGIVAAAMVMGQRRQTLWDRMARTTVASRTDARQVGAPTFADPGLPVHPLVAHPADGHVVVTNPPDLSTYGMHGVGTSLPTMQQPGARFSTALAPGLPQLQFDDGSILTVPPTVLIGRDPAPSREDADDVRLMAVVDPERQVSKTHLAVGADGSALWVEDRHSTNGVVVRSGGGVERLVPGRRHRLDVGMSIELGARRITVVDRD